MSQVLEILVRGLPAKRVLEIGTGTGDGALAIARALPDGGMLITLEADEQQAQAARQRLAHAGCGARVAVMIGTPARYLHKVAGPFDVIVHNGGLADRNALRSRLLDLLRPGGLLVGSGADVTVSLKP